MTAAKFARLATVHRIKYHDIRTPEQLSLTAAPAGCVSFKIGPDGPVGPTGTRLPSNVWCAVALFDDRAAAETALAANEGFLPLADAVEHWHALLLPITHRGECNHFERTNPRSLFDPGADDPGGPLFVMTTAGYNPPPDMARVIDFRCGCQQGARVARIGQRPRGEPGVRTAHVGRRRCDDVAVVQRCRHGRRDDTGPVSIARRSSGSKRDNLRRPHVVHALPRARQRRAALGVAAIRSSLPAVPAPGSCAAAARGTRTAPQRSGSAR